MKITPDEIRVIVPAVIAIGSRIVAYYFYEKKRFVASNTWYARSAWWLAIAAVVIAVGGRG